MNHVDLKRNYHHYENSPYSLEKKKRSLTDKPSFLRISLVISFGVV